MYKLRDELYAEASAGLNTREAVRELSKEKIELATGFIAVGITGGAYVAMDEWGTGSKMDTSNPDLQAYMSSSLWNPARKDTTIVTRPNTPGQIDIHGNPVKGHGDGGYDLEEAGIVEATHPSKALQTAMRWMENGRFREVIKNTIKNFDFSEFFEVD